MGVGMENTWTGSFQTASIAVERLTEQINIPNGQYLGARNSSDTATVKLIGYNANNQVSIAPLGQATVFGGNISASNVTATGSVAAASFSGDGSRLTNVIAAASATTATNALALGGLPRSAYATTAANAFSGSQSVTGDVTTSGNLSAGGVVSGATATFTNAITLQNSAGGTVTNLDNAGNASFNGKLGIGTSTPQANLDVTGSIRSALNNVIFSSTPTFDARLGNTQKIVLTANVISSTLANAAAGQFLYFIICQDASGGHAFSWPPNVSGGMAVGSQAGTCSAQAFAFDGAKAFAVSPGVAGM